jgi:hypothetical protein
MNLEFFVNRLVHQPVVIRSLVDDVDTVQARWKPAADRWSILEVVNHLEDEEREDFRPRLDSVLHRPGEPLPPIDPPRWAIERKYNERDLAESLERFLTERRKSLDWLGTLRQPDWESVHQLPHGPIRAGDILASWAAHDLLHVRQLAKLHWEYVNQESVPYETRYAGSW